MNRRIAVYAATAVTVASVLAAVSLLADHDTEVVQQVAAATVSIHDFDPEKTQIPKQIADTNNAFAIDFYRQVSDGDKNVFFSPTSIYMAFSALYEGTNVDASKQLEHAFGFDPDAKERHNATAQTMVSINRDDEYAELSIANGIWTKAVPVKPFMNTMEKVYMADVGELSADNINAWASNKTNGKIEEVAYDPLSIMAITNAIYFNGTWVTQFPKEDTKKHDFSVNDSKKIKTDFMNVEDVFEYADTGDIKILKMPYEGDRLSMLVILPKDTYSMESLEESLTVESLEQWQQQLKPLTVQVSIPKFELRTKYNLIEPLMSFGVTSIFSPNDDPLSKMFPGSYAYVSKATQDAFVNVNEEGTEAAAVTVIVGIISLQPPPPKFVADRPFLFMIQDDESGAILFLGKISNPPV